jgi:hypothetical protein
VDNVTFFMAGRKGNERSAMVALRIYGGNTMTIFEDRTYDPRVTQAALTFGVVLTHASTNEEGDEVQLLSSRKRLDIGSTRLEFFASNAANSSGIAIRDKNNDVVLRALPDNRWQMSRQWGTSGKLDFVETPEEVVFILPEELRGLTSKMLGVDMGALASAAF